MMHRHRSGLRWGDDQSGAYAVEFALAFVVCFLILYAVLTYGLIFMAQHSLNQAANSGARMLLAWAPDDADRVCRIQAAADKQLSWIRSMAGDGPVRVAVCLPADGGSGGGAGLCSDGGAAAALCPASVPTVPQARQAEVIVRYDYKDSPLLPVLGLGSWLSVPVPAVLQARSVVDMAISYPGDQGGS
ncbi:hypothetical protein GCM10009125_27800 [Castellaniella daejeonensis]|uniref:TadE-like domain-containing protein n=1 Tax=Castellaniella daejeonensis TaxID=659013 RepID=A0ABN0U3E6_9BURK